MCERCSICDLRFERETGLLSRRLCTSVSRWAFWLWRNGGVAVGLDGMVDHESNRLLRRAILAFRPHNHTFCARPVDLLDQTIDPETR